MSGKFPVTPEGYQLLKEELRKLKSEDRPAIMKAIEEAKGHGDLSENAEYHAAKEKQSLLEAKIREVEDRLARVEVIDPKLLKGDRVVFGATVTVCEEESGEEIRYRIVGEHESDIKSGKISITSPLARGLIGKSVSDVCEIRTPKGSREYSILRIDFE